MRACERYTAGTYQRGVADKLASKPEEGLLEVVVRLGGNIVVLEVLLAVEGNSLGLDLALLNIDLVTTENDGDVLADTDEVTCWAGLAWFGPEQRIRRGTYGASWGRSCM
jgi:hypothetical protein